MFHYRNLNSFLQEEFGDKVYKLALDGGFTCPNRDGKIDHRGCIFCSEGSGDFSIPTYDDIEAAVEAAKSVVANKRAGKYIAYFQRYTGTYASITRLRYLYTQAIRHPDIVAISIGTRPDCLPDETVSLLTELNKIKPVWIELGLQTIHPESAEYIRRGYSLNIYDDAVCRLLAEGLTVVVHMILGLPGETPEMMCQTAKYIGNSGVQGIKFQMLHVLQGTDLAHEYAAGKFDILSLEEYIRILEKCLQVIPPEMIVHRLTGDGSKRDRSLVEQRQKKSVERNQKSF